MLHDVSHVLRVVSSCPEPHVVGSAGTSVLEKRVAMGRIESGQDSFFPLRYTGYVSVCPTFRKVIDLVL